MKKKSIVIVVALALLLVLMMSASASAYQPPNETGATILDAFGWHAHGWTYVALIFDKSAGEPQQATVWFGGNISGVEVVRDVNRGNLKLGGIVLGIKGTYDTFWASVNNAWQESPWEGNDGVIP